MGLLQGHTIWGSIKVLHGVISGDLQLQLFGESERGGNLFDISARACNVEASKDLQLLAGSEPGDEKLHGALVMVDHRNKHQHSQETGSRQ